MANIISKVFSDTANNVVKSLMFGDYVDTVAPSVYRGGVSNGYFFFGGNGTDYRFAHNNQDSSMIAYKMCAPLAAVVNKKASAYISGTTKIINTQNKEVKTGSDYNKIKKLMTRPNPLQTWRQFEAQQYIYLQLFGWCICLPIKPAGFEKFGNIDATSLWNIPPYMVEVKETQKLFYQTDITGIIESVKLNYKGNVTPLPLDQIFIFRDFTPSAESMVIPSSRIKALELPIRNIISSYMTRGELINYAGAQGIISPEKDPMGVVPIQEPEKAALQEQFKAQYGIQRGQYRYIISATALKWTEMGKPTKDLLLFEEVAEDSKAICDNLGYPPHLMGLLDPTFNNQDKAEKGLFQNTIIPESESIYEQWQLFFGLDNLNLQIVKDYKKLPVMQEDQVSMWQARLFRDKALMIEFVNDLITQNEWRAENEQDAMKDGDKYFSDVKDDIAAVKVSTQAATETEIQEQVQTQQDEIPAPKK